LVVLAVLYSFAVLMMRIPNWGQEAATYRQIGSFLETNGAEKNDVVIVSNPPGYYLATTNPAIAVPDGGPDTIQELTQRYDARYLVLEEGSITAGLLPIYESPEGNPGLDYLGEVDGARVFAIQP
jgi:hypothetical protein